MINSRIPSIVLFGAVMMVMVGAFNMLDGVVALLSPEHFNDDVLVGSLKGWAWLFVVFGAVQIAFGFAIAGGSGFALWPGIVLAGANACLQLMFLPSYPIWSAIVMIADAIVIYAFTVQAMEVGTEESSA
jgi:hypothetical protein